MFQHFTRFHVNAKLFPDSTRKALPTALMIQFGALPLGFKSSRFLFKRTTTLNIGLLGPEGTDASPLEDAAKRALGPTAFSRVHVFKIQAVDFLDVLESVYGVNKEALEKIPDLHPTLRHFITLEKGLL